MVAETLVIAVGAIKGAKDFLEAAKFISTFDHSMAQLMGHGPDPILTALTLISNQLDEIQDLNLAAWASERNDSLAFLRAHSSTALQTIYAFQQSGALRSHPDWAARLALADRDSLLAVQTLTSDIEGGFWLRPYSLKAISWAGDPDIWMRVFSERVETDGFNRVWDYTWTLPASLYAIMARVAVMKVLADPFLFAQELATYNSFVGKVFRKRELGIRSLDTLSPLHIERIPTHMLPVAVVDFYGGFYVGGAFNPIFLPHQFDQPPYPPEIPELPLPRALLGGEPTIENNVRNHAVLTHHFRNYVAIRTGLTELLQFAGAIENLLTEVQSWIWVPDVGLEDLQHYRYP